MDNTFEWLKFAAAVLAGGLAGAILNSFVSAYRARIQPIGKRVEITPLFTPSFIGSTLQPTITISGGSSPRQFANLHMVEVTIVNRGNRDFASFKFGLTLSSGDSCVHVEPSSSDRHHVVSVASRVTPEDPSAAFDFDLKPLNRNDAYTLKLFIVAGNAAPGEVQISTAEAVRFVEIPSFSATLAGVAAQVLVKAGPFHVSISS